jgi:exopolysaccharide biosynthesis polyprenyl glycosylphosphotransferase
MTIVLSVFVSLRIWAFVARYRFDLDFVLPQLYWFFVLVFVWFVLASANDFYNLRITARISTSLARLAQITLQLLIIYLVIFFLSPRDALPRLFILYHAVISFVLMFLWRVWRPFMIGWSRFRRRRALIIGTGWAAETILQTVSTEASEDYEIVGLIGAEREIGQVIGGKPVLGNGKNLAAVAQRYGIAELIMAYGAELPGDIFQGIMTCYEQEITTGRVPIEHVGQQHWAVVLPIEGHSLFNLYSPMKRLMDVVLAVIGLAIFVVILVPLALLMTLDSPGPIFYRQERVGRGGRVFRVIKLRTMIPDAESESGPQWAQRNDPRITRLGRIMRKIRLDEVPQLINVLQDDMSIIGPRPERPVFVDQLARQIPFYRTRHVVKPGLTGWAQVCYHYGNTTEDALVKLQYDLYYIRHQSLVLDLQIALRTLGTMLAFQGT